MRDRATIKAVLLTSIAFFGIIGLVFTFIGIERPMIANMAITTGLAIISFSCGYALEVGIFPARAEKRRRRLRQAVLRGGSELAIAGSELRDVGLAVPTVRIEDMELSQTERDRAICAELGLDPRTTLADIRRRRVAATMNDGHLILRKPLSLLNDTAVGRRTDHAAVISMAEALGHRPDVLTANVLLVNPKRGMVGLHQRSRANETEQDKLHVVGGAFDPDRDQNLSMTAERETREETGYAVSTKGCPIVLQHETQTNYTMVTFVGVPVPQVTWTSFKEGELLWFRIDDLPGLVGGEERRWVCTGKQAILVWLALGAPVGGGRGLRSRRHIRRLLEACRRSFDARRLGQSGDSAGPDAVSPRPR